MQYAPLTCFPNKESTI